MHRKWIAVLAFASAGQALAQDSDEQQGAYIGVGIGDFSSQIDQLNGVDINFDEDESSYKIFGGWRFNQFFAAQIDYLDLGRSNSTIGGQNFDVETAGYVARIEGTLPLAFFELFATAGMVYSSVEATAAGIEVLDESGSDPIYSVGAGLEIAERFVLRLEYEIIDIDTFDDAEAIWLSAAWRF